MYKLLLSLIAGLLVSVGQPTTARSFDFFELPQFTSATHFRWTDGEWIQTARTLPFYSNQKLDSAHTETYDAGIYTLSRREIHTYVDHYLHYCETYKLFSDQWEIAGLDSFLIYTNDTTDWTFEQHAHIYEHGERVGTQRITTTYDSWLVHILSKLEERIDPGPTRDEVLWTYEYMPLSALLSAIVKQVWNGSEWTDGTREVWSYSKDTWDGVLTEITLQVFQNGEWHNVEKTVFEGIAAPASVSPFTEEQPAVMYPNPATNEFYLNSTSPQTLTIFDIHGREVKRLTSLSDETAIDVHDLSQGQYVVTVNREGSQQRVEKLTIQR